jgi:phage tail-like protein
MRSAEIRRLLPSIFRRTATPGSPLAAVLDVMQDLHAPIEGAFVRFPLALDPMTAPDAFVPFLAEWVDMWQLVAGEDRIDRPGRTAAALLVDTGRLRELVGAAAELAKWRGTARGLAKLLEIATGVKGFRVADSVGADGVARPFAIEVEVPAPAVPQLLLVRRIVSLEKPAYAACAIHVAPPAPAPA